MEWWRWKNSDFEVARARAGQPLPPGVQPEANARHGVIGTVQVNGYPLPVKDGQWVRYVGEGDSRKVVSVVDDDRLREQAVCLEE